MYEPKVGDKIGFKGQPNYDRCEVLLVTDQHVIVNVNQVNDDKVIPQVWHKDKVLPPPPTVVFENWLNVYRKGMSVTSQSCVFGNRSPKEAVDSASQQYLTEHVRIYMLSDGTWHIEKVVLPQG